ncbi:MFS transporter, partial [Chloroflexota bacterium]
GAMLWLIGSTSTWMLYPFAVVYGLFQGGGFEAPTNALVGEIFGLRSVGVIMGALATGWGIGAAIGPTLAGYIFDISGSYSAAFLTGAIAMSVAAFFFLLLQAPKAARGKG